MPIAFVIDPDDIDHKMGVSSYFQTTMVLASTRHLFLAHRLEIVQCHASPPLPTLIDIKFRTS